MSRLQRLTARLGEIGSPGERAETQVSTAGIDLMGCILLGASHPVASGARTALAGCTGSAAAFGAGLRLASPVAALANATAGHCLDFDDWEEPGNTHPSTVMLPALWAVAAERGHGGGAVADAYRIGFEIIARLGEAVTHEHYTRGWHSTATLGVIGAAAGTARLIGLE
ncbi:MAG: MmgE/PrpD family protein, partial [Pseudomonadota bacterium]